MEEKIEKEEDGESLTRDFDREEERTYGKFIERDVGEFADVSEYKENCIRSNFENDERYIQYADECTIFIPTRRCAIDYKSRSGSTFFPTFSERKLFESNSRNNRTYIERWRREWGKRPTGFREGRDYHYWWWRKTYIHYLRIIYDRILKYMNSYKKISIRKIRFEEFIELAYINSSGYITPHT